MIPSYKEFNIMNSQEQMGIYKEMEQKGWLNSADLFRTRDTGVYGRMYRLIDEYNNSNGQRRIAQHHRRPVTLTSAKRNAQH